RITLRTSRVNAILGTELRDTDVLDALRPLEVDVTGNGEDIVAIPPTFRPDLEREIDLIEEVARRVGFDRIGRTVARPRDQVGGLTAAQTERRHVTDALVGVGAAEVTTIPLVAPALLAMLGVGDTVALANPLRADESVLRASLLPGLLTVAAANTARGRPDLALFEVGAVFFPPDTDQLLPVERLDVGALLTGTLERRPLEADRPVDAYDAVDLVRVVADTLELDDWDLEAATISGYHPGRAARIRAGGAVVGAVGELHRDVLATVGLAGPVVGFDADLEALRAARRRDRTFRPLSPYPPSTIDLAFVVDDTVPAAAITKTLRDAAEGLAEEVRAFDEFHSPTLGAGKRSVGFALRFRAPDRTLTDADVATLRRRCIDAVTTAYGATLRQ
ncbi:MAG TPA: hypothetical protein VIJ44_09175, partial [Acidimicrobiia bacterium]